jgi:hypothetical protein
MESVFIFNGIGYQFPSGVFTTKEKALAWVAKHGLSGTITEMPIDISAYDHAVENDLFTPKKPHESTPKFMASFSSRLWHDHFGPDWKRDEVQKTE